MSQNFHTYAEFVEHPRYGRSPKITGLNPEIDYGAGITIHWHSPKECRIPNTAIPADIKRQIPGIFPISHYYDVIRQCRDCRRSFIFFAEEQKYWYEDLGYYIGANCVRCVPCRKLKQVISRHRKRYEELFHKLERTGEETMEMAECCLSLIETRIFSPHQTQHVRMLLNRLKENFEAECVSRCDAIRIRLKSLEE